jgi:uncharacterized protein
MRRSLHLMAAILLWAGLGIITDPAAAQGDGIVLAQNREGPGIFRFLFGERRDPPRYYIPGPPPPGARPAAPRRTVRPKASRPAASAAPAAPRVEEVDKAENAKRVLVVGDFFARSAARGLAAAYAENPNVLVIDATNGSSGLVRDDFYDWPGSIPSLVEEHRPDAIVAMLGANDRQSISTESGSKSVGDEAWRPAYAARVQAFADALAKPGLPVFWGSLVPAERSALTRDYSSFNTIFQEGIAGKAIRYVDLWGGFADAEGRFTSVGPDVQGQSVRLRDSDGLNFTRAGQAKLAFFFQRDLDALIGGTLPAVAVPGAVAGPAAPAIGPMVPIGALTVATGDTLATAGEEPEESVADAVVKRLEAEPPKARADNFTWSGVR